MAAPAAPVLKIEGSAVTVSFDVPAGASVAVVYVVSSRYGKQFYDAELKSVLQSGKTGKVISLATKDAGRTSVKSKSVEVTNLAGGVDYTATVSFRGADDFDWGPTSPASAPLTLVLPIAPQAPRLEPVSQTEIRVHFVLPPDSVKLAIYFNDGTTSEKTVLPDMTLVQTEQGKPIGCWKGPSVVIKGLSKTSTYKVGLEGHNGLNWGLRWCRGRPRLLRAIDALRPLRSRL